MPPRSAVKKIMPTVDLDGGGIVTIAQNTTKICAAGQLKNGYPACGGVLYAKGLIMALISGVPSVTQRRVRPIHVIEHPNPTARMHSPGPAQAVQPVPAVTKPCPPALKRHPVHFDANVQSKPVIEVDGIPFVHDEAVLGDDIVRPEVEPECKVAQDTANEPQFALPLRVLVTAPANYASRTDIGPVAHATPWPESLQILRGTG
jgi:hypothetical protein